MPFLQTVFGDFGLVPLVVGRATAAEVFGVDSLGAISSVVGSAGVFATALSPALFGWLLDVGLDVDLLVLGGVALAVLVSAIGLLAPSTPGHRRERPTSSEMGGD